MFKRGDIVIHTGHTYSITDDRNPCVVRGSYEDLSSWSKIRYSNSIGSLTRGAMLVEPLVRRRGECFLVEERFFRKIYDNSDVSDKIAHRPIFNVGEEVKLDSMYSLYHNIKDGKVRIIDIDFNNTEDGQRYGDVVVNIEGTKDYFFVDSIFLKKINE